MSGARTVAAAGTLYFLLVFACGFVLGVPRTLWLAPRIGERWAELIETPVMLAVSFLAARWVVRRFSLPARGRPAQAAVGALGLVLMLSAEAALVAFQGTSIGDYVAQRDPISGSVYLLALLLFACMPTLAAADLVSRSRSRLHSSTATSA